MSSGGKKKKKRKKVHRHTKGYMSERAKEGEERGESVGKRGGAGWIRWVEEAISGGAKGKKRAWVAWIGGKSGAGRRSKSRSDASLLHGRRSFRVYSSRPEEWTPESFSLVIRDGGQLQKPSSPVVDDHRAFSYPPGKDTVVLWGGGVGQIFFYILDPGRSFFFFFFFSFFFHEPFFQRRHPRRSVGPLFRATVAFLSLAFSRSFVRSFLSLSLSLSLERFVRGEWALARTYVFLRTNFCLDVLRRDWKILRRVFHFSLDQNITKINSRVSTFYRFIRSTFERRFHRIIVSTRGKFCGKSWRQSDYIVRWMLENAGWRERASERGNRWCKGWTFRSGYRDYWSVCSIVGASQHGWPYTRYASWGLGTELCQEGHRSIPSDLRSTAKNVSRERQARLGLSGRTQASCMVPNRGLEIACDHGSRGGTSMILCLTATKISA